jgi:hypothetical protein
MGVVWKTVTAKHTVFKKDHLQLQSVSRYRGPFITAHFAFSIFLLTQHKHVNEPTMSASAAISLPSFYLPDVSTLGASFWYFFSFPFSLFPSVESSLVKELNSTSIWCQALSSWLSSIGFFFRS